MAVSLMIGAGDAAGAAAWEYRQVKVAVRHLFGTRQEGATLSDSYNLHGQS